jgi:uncharacterized SAM-binding protein YcdF (DUF218 family)
MAILSWAVLLIILALVATTAWLVLGIDLVRTQPRRWWSVAAGGLAAALVVLIAAGMDFDTGRLVGKLCMPLGAFWLLLLFLAALALLRRAWWVGGGWLALTLAYSLVTSDGLGTWLMAGLEDTLPPSAAGGPPLDAVFVLGGGVRLRPDGAGELGDAGDRVLQAAILFRSGRTHRLVASSATAPATAALWSGLGIPAAAITVLPDPLNTGDEIAAYAQLCRHEHWTRTGLVSSAWHLPRALRLCARAGLAMQALPCDWLSRTQTASALLLVPQIDGVQKVNLALWERIGMAVGH